MAHVADSPSSLLWATQLRQENIHLTRKMNELNNFLNSLTATIDSLRQSIDLQAEHIDELERQHKQDKEQLVTNIRDFDAKIRGLEARTSGRGSGEDNDERLEDFLEQVRKLEEANRELTAKVTETSDKFNALQAENGTLRVGIGETRQRLGALEKENAALKQEITRADENFGLYEQANGPLKTKLMAVLQQFDKTSNENAELKVQVGEVAGKCGILETEKAQLKQDLTGLAQTLERSQSENDDLQGRVRLLENGVSLLEKQATKTQNWMSMKTIAEDRDRAKSAKPQLARAQTDQDGDQSMRIPDSMPTPTSRRSTREKAAYRTASETTWGSLTDLDASCTPKRSGATASPSKKDVDVQEILATLAQNGRSLASYLQWADSIKKRARSTMPDGTFIFAFMAGLEDEDLKKRLKVHTGRAGVSWSSVMPLVQAEITKLGKDQKAEEQGDEKVMRTPVKQDSEGLGRGSFGFRKENRPRRSIPIVPVDEEDEELMN